MQVLPMDKTTAVENQFSSVSTVDIIGFIIFVCLFCFSISSWPAARYSRQRGARRLTEL